MPREEALPPAGALSNRRPSPLHLLLALPPSRAGAKAGLEYLLRVAFGTALIVSVVAVFAAITVISSSSSNDNRREQRGGGGGYYGGGPRFMFDMTDLLWYW